MASGKSEDPLEFDDPKGLLKTVLDQVKSLQTSFSVPLLSVVPLFNGDAEKFRQYVKDVERYYTPATKLGGYTGITLSVRPSVRLSVCPSVCL